ncbi:MAG: metallophosphoesterase [Chryseotalea sp. WA131a]|jgi:hypothetical protein|nr:MAG: metallophosphoesterase [Chryseotalea sp. WA131a]
MRIVVFSDIHGNLPAFEKMLMNEHDVGLYISLGDVVNYGPWGNECVDLLESLPSVRLMGNHEEYFLTGKYPGLNELVIRFFDTCFSQFDRAQQISGYIAHYEFNGYRFQHTINDSYIFPDSKIEISGKYFIGHSHHQFDRSADNYQIINVGSVGQNRSEINVINYAVYDTEADTVQFISLVYDLDLLISKMKALRYHQSCIDYYLQKRLRC